MNEGPTSGSSTIPEPIVILRDHYVSALGRTTRAILDEGQSTEKAEDIASIAGAYAEREVADWRTRPDSPKGVACRAGCAFCCHVPVATTIPEAILIANTLLFERTEEELAQARDKVERAYLSREKLVGKSRDRARHPCPMLDEVAGKCTIYDIRPLNCRGWNSLDASRCESFFDDPSRAGPIPIDGVQRTITQAIADGIGIGLESRGLEHSTVDLAAALRLLLDDPTAIDRWLVGEPAFLEAESSTIGAE